MANSVVVITGPTGVGKTVVSLELALHFQGEIISADSMQVYRYMDIGTAKPSRLFRELIPHHLIDVVNPDEHFNAALFMEEARRTIGRLTAEGKSFFVAGGCGLYIKALLGGLFPCPTSSVELRAYLKKIKNREGTTRLYEMLKERDEKAASVIKPTDASRIMRAIEVWELTGKSIIDMQRNHRFQDRPYRFLKIGLYTEREKLYKVIDERVDEMVRQGLEEEVKGLLDRGYGPDLKAMQSLGYRHMAKYLLGEWGREEAIFALKRDTKHYAKRQLTWFKADREIIWFRREEFPALIEYIERFYEGKGLT